MSVTTTSNRISYDGDGVSTVFSFPYKFLATSDLKVYVDDVLQVLTTDYTVGTPSDSGANVTFLSAPDVGDNNIVILRDVDLLQSTDLPSNGPFPSVSVETMVDKVTLQAQRLRELVSRAFTLSDSDTSGASTTLPTPTASNVIGWNETASALRNFTPETFASLVAYGTANADIFSGDGTTTHFTLTEDPVALNNMDVSVSGVTQTPGIDYTWARGRTLTFTSAPPSGTDNILVRYMEALPQGQGDAAATSFDPGLSGSSTRTVESKLREFISVKDFGAVGDGVTNDFAAFQSAYDAAETGQKILVPEGTYFGVSGSVTGSKFVIWIADGTVSGGSAWVLPGIVMTGFTNRLMFNVASTDGGDFGRVEFRRVTNHTNGTPGDVSSNLRVTTTVNDGPDNFEWGFLSVLNNGALGAGENVAIYGQANKSAGGAGPTWAGVFEARNANNTAETGGGLVGIEVDVFANGADTSTNRVGIDLVIGKADAGGSTPTVTYGLRIAAQNGVSANGTYTNGISIQNAATTGIEIASTGTVGIKFSSSATLTVGIDFSQTSGLTSAIRFARSQKIDLEPTSTLQEDTAAVQNVRRLLNSGTERVGFDLSGGASTGLRVNATKVVGAQEAGFAAFTGTTNKGTTYATGTVTLVQLAERVAAIQAALTTHGLITI